LPATSTATAERPTKTKTTNAMTKMAPDCKPKEEPGRLLADIVKEIMAAYQDLTDAFKAFTRDNTPRYLSMGKCLNEAKKQLGHGPFTHWVEENFPFTPQHARNCMRIVDNWTMLQPKFENENRFSFSLANEYVRELRGKPAPRRRSTPIRALPLGTKLVALGAQNGATSVIALPAPVEPAMAAMSQTTLKEIAAALRGFVEGQVTNFVTDFPTSNTELVRNTVWKTVQGEAVKHLQIQGLMVA